jgi:hypothetical protein
MFQADTFAFAVDRTVNLATLDPVLSAVDGNGAALLGVSNGGLTRASYLTVTGEVESGATVLVSVNNGAAHAAQVMTDVTGTHYSYRTAELLSGNNVIRVSYTDQAGNKAPDNIFTATVDASITSAYLDFSQIRTDQGIKSAYVTKGSTYINDKTPGFSGRGEAGARVEIRIDGQLDGVATLAPADATKVVSNWTYDVTTPLADGAHSVVARVIDQAGNALDSQTLTMTIDTDPGSVSINQFGINGTWDTNTASDVVQTTYISPGDKLTGNLSDFSFVKVEIYDGDQKLGNATIDNLRWSFNTTKLTSGHGDHLYKAVATDIAGNVTESAYIPFTTVQILPGGDISAGGATFKKYFNESHLTHPTDNNGPANDIIGLTSNSTWGRVTPAVPSVSPRQFEAGQGWVVNGNGGDDTVMCIGPYVPLQKFDGGSGFDALRIDSGIGPSSTTTLQTAGAMPLIFGVERIDLCSFGNDILNIANIDATKLGTKILAISGGHDDIVINTGDTSRWLIDDRNIVDLAIVNAYGDIGSKILQADRDQGRSTQYHVYTIHNSSVGSHGASGDDLTVLINVGVQQNLGHVVLH